jgi:hypothetical protein
MGDNLRFHLDRLKRCDAPSCRSRVADEMADLLEREISHPGDVQNETLRSALHALMSLALSEPESEARESLLHALVNASSLARARGERFDAGPLARALDTFDIGELEHGLYVVGFSQQTSLLPAVERFLDHPNPHVQGVARQARQELLANGA